MTALTLYPNNVAASVSTANKLIENPGTTNTTNFTNLNTNLTSGTTGWVELYSQGNGTGQTGAGSQPSPSGHGWLEDTTLIEGNHFQSGTWTWTVELETTTTGTFTCDIHCRAYQRSSGGTYTLIAEGIATSQTVVSTSYTQFTVTKTGASASNTFATGDKFYTDVTLNITTNGTTGNIRVHMSNSVTIGYANVSITTPGYISSTQTDKDLALRGRVSAQVDKDLALRARVSAQVDKDVKIRGNIGTQAQKDVKIRGVVAGLGLKNLALRARVQQLTSKNLALRGKPANTSARDIAIRARITGPPLTSGGFTLFANGTGTVQYDSFRVTEYPDPSLSLAPITGGLIPGTAIQLADDTMVRDNVASGFGVATDAQLYTQIGTGTTNLVSDEAQISNTTGDLHMLLGTKTWDSEDGVVRFQLSAATISAGIELRYVDANNLYRLVAAQNSLSIVQRIGGVNTTLISATPTIALNTYYWMRFRVTSLNPPGSLFGRVWADDGGTEPTAWNVFI